MSDYRFSPWIKQTQKDLSIERILASALSSMHVGIAVLDPEFNFVLVNEAFPAENGGRGLPLGKNFFQLYPNQENETLFREVAETGRSYYVSGRPFTSPDPGDEDDAAPMWDWNLRPVFDHAGRLSYLVLMLLDVTEREQTYQELAEKELLLSQLFEMAPDANLLVEPDGAIRQVNRQAVNMFGYPAEDMLGLSIDSLVPDASKRRHAGQRKRFHNRPYRRPLGRHGEFYARRRDGSEFPVEIMLSPIATPQGDYVLCTVRDISVQRQAESELTEMRRRLLIGAEGEKVALARELHDSAIQDLYGALYEIQLIKDELSMEGQQVVSEVVETIKQVNNRLRTTIADLRPTTLISFGLEKAIRSYAGRFQEAYPEIEVSLDLDADTHALTDEIRLGLYRIYIQLLTNAAQHADATDIWVRLKLSDEQVVLEVQDDGRGFTPPRRWIEQAREGRLGLIDVSERAQGMGGQIHIDSKPGRGTLVRVTIPLAYLTGD